jgi:hypothetical protein
MLASLQPDRWSFRKILVGSRSTLQLGLYYRDGSNNQVMVRSTIITYSMEAFPTNLPLNLIDYHVNVQSFNQVMLGWQEYWHSITVNDTFATGNGWQLGLRQCPLEWCS